LVGGAMSRRLRSRADHVGIDLHQRESQIRTLTEDGDIVELRIRTERQRFDAIIRPNEVSEHSGSYAGASGGSWTEAAIVAWS
jgi:hypothetical protein